MYRCDNCKAVQAPGTPQFKRVTTTRAIEYQPRYAANRGGFDDPGGHGTATVHEARLCPPCAGVDVKPRVRVQRQPDVAPAVLDGPKVAATVLADPMAAAAKIYGVTAADMAGGVVAKVQARRGKAAR